MSEHDVRDFLAREYAQVRVTSAWGATFFYYAPTEDLDAGAYFATVKVDDDPYDTFSDLARPGVYRLSLGVSRVSFQRLFPDPDATWDFRAFDDITPHPVYGKQHWLAVLDPSDATLRDLRPLIDEAYAIAVATVDRRARRNE